MNKLADKLITTLTGLAVALIALFPLRSAGVSEEVWIGLVMTGLTLAVAGPSALAAAGGKSDKNEEGFASVGMIAVLLTFAALTTALISCASNRIVVRHALDFARRPGPCFVRLTVDGREIIAEAEDPTIHCDPPPEFCAPSPR